MTSSAELCLLIGNKNYSSWSLRPWLLLKQLGLPFQEKRVSLYQTETREQIMRHSPSGKVPALYLDGQWVWDSLAICETLAERYPQAWPQDAKARAQARAIVAEMHSGFFELRNQMPMNCRRRQALSHCNEFLLEDMRRIQQIWQDCLEQSAGPFLFGDFSIADAFYAPVVLRFYSYEVELDQPLRGYMDTILSLPALQEWMAAAQAETEVISAAEVQD
ncbi:glutathione S-transferase family protein [Balneatrix alpica]|uniref:glutathione S-transferase family protein n=1 Tax=Balneatrix alpica TaxID=75684 RepID=UPI002739985E|nr:glutathione S-transferase family protein [Balneatrix alpica]